MSLLKTIKTRRTVRKFKSKKIPKKLVRNIVDAGRWASSAHNFQPWKFVAVNNRSKIVELSYVLEKEADNLFAGFNVVMRDTASEIRVAPNLLLVYSGRDMSKKFSRLGGRYKRMAGVYEVQSVSNAIQVMLLYAHEIGIGMAWYGMPLFCGKKVNRLFKVSGDLMAILAFGYSDEKPRIVGRKKVDEILTFHK